MNYRQIARFIALLLLLVGLAMTSSLAWSWADWDNPKERDAAQALVLSVVITLLAALTLRAVGGSRTREPLYRKEAMAIVGLGWMASGLAGALPFILSGTLPNLADAVFESFSGFSTTGATVVTDLSVIPRSILFWRSLTHWLGGMGIVVLFVVVLGSVGAAGRLLFASEVAGPTTSASRTRIRQTAIMLWVIYMGLSVAQLVLLLIAGMTFFDALCHTFGTLATGGFSTYNESVKYFASVPIELIITVFMLLAGVNFNLYYEIARGHWQQVFKNTELRIYLGILLAVTVVIGILLWDEQTPFWQSIRHSGFTAISIMTTTGFGTADFNEWSTFPKGILLLLMFVGGCAGSTGGGLKVVRIVMLVKVVLLEIERSFRPNVVRRLRVDHNVMDTQICHETVAYCALVLSVFLLGSLAMTLLEPELDLVASGTAVVATLNNIGPGLGAIGPTGNYSELHAPTKYLLSLFMIMGRLEVYVILALLVPRFWRAA